MYPRHQLFLIQISSADRNISLLPNTEQDRVMNHVIESRIVSILRDTIGEHPVLWFLRMDIIWLTLISRSKDGSAV